MEPYPKERSSHQVQDQICTFGLPLVQNGELCHYNSSTKSGLGVYWKQHSPLKVLRLVAGATFQTSVEPR